VIECFPNGVARESRRPRTASQLELHPRDVVLFAPISRLAAPQRATIAVRCGHGHGHGHVRTRVRGWVSARVHISYGAGRRAEGFRSRAA
jgi:hypothetical protein